MGAQPLVQSRQTLKWESQKGTHIIIQQKILKLDCEANRLSLQKETAQSCVLD